LIATGDQDAGTEKVQEGNDPPLGHGNNKNHQ
jgi:hypothetical protein